MTISSSRLPLRQQRYLQRVAIPFAILLLGAFIVIGAACIGKALASAPQQSPRQGTVIAVTNLTPDGNTAAVIRLTELYQNTNILVSDLGWRPAEQPAVGSPWQYWMRSSDLKPRASQYPAEMPSFWKNDVFCLGLVVGGFGVVFIAIASSGWDGLRLGFWRRSTR